MRAISGPHFLFSAIARQRFEIKRAADEDLAGGAEDAFSCCGLFQQGTASGFSTRQANVVSASERLS
jgi:hypothetical protein